MVGTRCIVCIVLSFDEERSMKALVIRLVAEEEPLKCKLQPQKKISDGSSDDFRADTSPSRLNNQIEIYRKCFKVYHSSFLNAVYFSVRVIV